MNDRVLVMGLRDPANTSETNSTPNSVTTTTDTGNTELTIDKYLQAQKEMKSDLFVSLSSLLGFHFLFSFHFLFIFNFFLFFNNFFFIFL